MATLKGATGIYNIPDPLAKYLKYPKGRSIEDIILFAKKEFKPTVQIDLDNLGISLDFLVQDGVLYRDDKKIFHFKKGFRIQWSSNKKVLS